MNSPTQLVKSRLPTNFLGVFLYLKNISERSVRNYCQNGSVPGAVQDKLAWLIPDDAHKPIRKQRSGKIPTDLLSRLNMEKDIEAYKLYMYYISKTKEEG